ncbi:MAG: hypothetical protein LC798_05845 [Chloroflexi bacterium]|nr:hypothetical protein [Chloroflexota bacterium]
MIDPRNISAQLLHRATGNPPSTVIDSAVSNAFPGLEFDIRNIWRRIFAGIELHEATGQVVTAEPPIGDLRGWTLVEAAGFRLQVPAGSPPQPNDAQDPVGELSNSLAEVLFAHVGEEVTCTFRQLGEPPTPPRDVTLLVRDVFARSSVTQGRTGALSDELVQPGELTQSLCSPWQNDYRECACYYWAASRPDYVNVELGEDGTSHGNNWLDRRTTDRYVPEVPDPKDPASPLVTYDELFQDWQRTLRFIIGGRDIA